MIRDLEDEFRLIAPDLMGLGDTETPLDHRYDMEAQADKLLELADRLGLATFTLVCHDQGGAAAQWLAVHNPERIERFIMTNCVCYDNWPVPIVARFAKVFRVKPLATLMHRLRLNEWWGKSPVGIRLGVHDPERSHGLRDRRVHQDQPHGPGQVRAVPALHPCGRLSVHRGGGERSSASSTGPR